MQKFIVLVVKIKLLYLTLIVFSFCTVLLFSFVDISLAVQLFSNVAKLKYAKKFII